MNDASHPPADDPRPAPPRRYRALQTLEAPLTNLVGLSCRDFARLTVTRLDRPLTAGEAVRHRLHGAICGLCTRFAAQFSVLNDLTREIESEENIAPPAPPDYDPAAISRIADAVRAATKKPPHG